VTARNHFAEWSPLSGLSCFTKIVKLSNFVSMVNPKKKASEKEGQRKKRQTTDEPLKINGSLDDVLKASFSKPQEKKEEKK